MNAKSENASFDNVVSEALQKMHDLTLSSSAYEVDRSSGQWIVRRSSKTSEKGFPTEIVAQLTGAQGTD